MGYVHKLDCVRVPHLSLRFLFSSSSCPIAYIIFSLTAPAHWHTPVELFISYDAIHEVFTSLSSIVQEKYYSNSILTFKKMLSFSAIPFISGFHSGQFSVSF